MDKGHNKTKYHNNNNQYKDVDTWTFEEETRLKRVKTQIQKKN